MADLLSKVRDALLQIASEQKRFRFSDGTVNASALARALDVNASTINRVLRGNRNLVHPKDRGRKAKSVPEYNPSQALLHGIASLTGCEDMEQVWSYILESRHQR